MKSRSRELLLVLLLSACGAPTESPRPPVDSKSAPSIPVAPVSASSPGAGLVTPPSAPSSAPIAPLPDAAQGPAGDSEDLSKWIKERVKNAKGGSPELVRVPLSYNTGWGCECPVHQIGFAGYEGSELNLWAEPILAPGLKFPEFPEYEVDPDTKEKIPVGSAGLDWTVIAEGNFTGKTSTQRPDPDSDPYVVSEFQVLRYRLAKGSADYHFGAPDEDSPDYYAHVLLSGEAYKQKVEAFSDGKPWLIMAGSFPSSSRDTPTKAEALKKKLTDAGLPAESFDSRQAQLLFCCYQVVVAGRYATEAEAKAALPNVKKSFSDVYVKRGF